MTSPIRTGAITTSGSRFWNEWSQAQGCATTASTDDPGAWLGCNQPSGRAKEEATWPNLPAFWPVLPVGGALLPGAEWHSH